MKIESCEIWKDRDCNECHSQNDVKEIYLGSNSLALCADCREKLKVLLGTEQPIGIKLRNINLTGLTLVDELEKAEEEEKEFIQALITFLNDRHDISREHLLEELCDTIQVKLSIMKTIDIDIKEIVDYWNTKHLGKLQFRPKR